MIERPFWGDDKMAHEVYNVIQRIADEQKVVLSDAAREMLAWPVIEQFPSDASVTWQMVEPSIRKVIASVREPNDRDSGDTTSGQLNAKAIIRGYWREFCNIPPFCGRTERRTR